MVNCAVINCKNCTNARRKNKANVSFHRFPHEPNLKQKWIEATGNKDWFPTKNSTICSIHFEEVSFVEGKKQRILTKAAYPTVDVLKITTDENEDSLLSDDGNEIKVFCPKCNAKISHTAEEIQEDRIKIIIAKVYHYLEQEYEELKKSFDDLERTPLSKFSQRTALATGVSETTVVEILREEARHNAEAPEEPSPNESCTRKRPMQTDTEREQTLVLKEEPDEEPPESVQEEPEIYVEMLEVKDEPGVSGAKDALADPICIVFKIESQDEEATSSNDTTIEQSATKSYKRRKTKQYTPAVNAASAPPSPNAPPASPRRHSNNTPEVQSATKNYKRSKTKRNTEALTAGSAPPSPNAPSASARQQNLLLDEGEIKMEQIESDEGFS